MTRATEADHNRQSQELTIFHDVAKALTSSLDLDSILQTIMEKMAEYFRPDTWSLLMVDDEREELYFAIARLGPESMGSLSAWRSLPIYPPRRVWTY